MIKLCSYSDIPEGDAKGFEIQGKKLVALNYRNEIYIYENSCPHRSIPLEWQPDQFLDYEKTFIQCATHGALFKIDTGECIAGPCVEDQLNKIAFIRQGDDILIDL
ncbi:MULTISPECIES: Rieske (2Fe-2S) protein [Neptuniibacter]|jgi:nitrite reductase/ring-hydroxylating ferredoxin subunit|uniref:Rieske (2Fe-2S) protein n=1 Tax=Neptuniibacter TaxID=459520 RepID=UPI00082BD39F|nr:MULTISPECIES: Rieske (2Fe-2S) protein [Neptuniibacter]MDO6515235.1 Rieske (2Fe-2S) protein [Neptuniibacter sp. 2_MG-2023]MDO6595002.1 Rieske (2Fe-2S) protein [Neptuniibacter sp. 1_MG-2023]